MTTMPLSVPQFPNEVNEQWLKSVMELHFPGQSISVSSLEPEKEKSGLLSCIFRAVVKTGLAEIKLFIKIMPQDDVHMTLMRINQMDVTEVGFYKEYLVDLANYADNLGIRDSIESMVPKFYSGDFCLDNNKRGFYLILEDLSDREFAISDFNAGLTVNQTEEALVNLAKFHALSYCFGKARSVSFTESYQFFSKFFDNFRTDKELQGFMEMNIGMIEDDLAKSQDFKSLLPYVKGLRGRIGPLYADLLLKGFENFVIHGDIWVNNIMYRRGSTENRIVDWQFLAIGSPFLDFGTVAMLSMKVKETEKHLQRLIDAYYGAFRTVCQSASTDVPWAEDEFSREARRQGFLMAFLWGSTSYELTEMYDDYRDRTQWALKQSVLLNPEVFE